MTRLSRALACLALAACSAPEEPPPPEAGPAERKRSLLLAAEADIHRLLREARREGAQVREQFEAAVAALPRAFRLSTSDPELVTYGASDQRERTDRVKQIENTTKARVQVLLERYETALWDAARRAAERQPGADLGSRTGYVDLDAKVDAAMLQLERDANVEQIEQAAMLKVYEDVILERELRHEVADVGILSLFKSPPTIGLFAPRQEGQAAAVAFVRTALPPQVPLSLVQATRGRVERGGLLLEATPWQLDPATRNGSGKLELRADIDPKACIASEIMVPSVDVEAPWFEGLRDHVLVREYRTMLRRDDTGEAIATLGWQVRWNVDYRGVMRVLVDPQDRVVTDDGLVRSLVRAASAKQ